VALQHISLRRSELAVDIVGMATHAPEVRRNSRETAAPMREASEPTQGLSETAASVVEMEQREREPQSFGLRLAEGVTSFSGSLAFVAINALLFTCWVTWNTGIGGLPVFDPYPFTFLTFAVSLEAIFLSTFVLMSQNRQSARADHRAIIDLQVDAIAERELTKILKIVADIHEHVGAGTEHDPELEEMLNTLPVSELEQRAAEAAQGATKRAAS
jgi:uncharacterized membrane protein